MRIFKSVRAQSCVSAALWTAAVAIACESTTPDMVAVVDQKAKNVPAAPSAGKGVQFVGPKLTIAAGEEKMLCWVPDWTPDKDYFIRKFRGFQGSMGHHVVALQDKAGNYKPGETFDCSSLAQMVNLQPLVLPDPDSHSDKALLQEGYAVRMLKGARPVFQSHYVNYGSKPIEIQDVARIDYALEANPVEVSYFILNDGLIDIAAKGETTRSMTCKAPSDIKILATMGHMHEMGTKMKIEQLRPADASFAAKTMYNVAQWKPEFRDAGPVEIFGVGNTALDLKAGDEIKVTCTWNNTAGKQLFFPKEMCSTVSYYFPATKEGLIICNKE
ncbi:MAG: hypothetical protein FJ100_17250 [Deltaproteobacteria bacterium]|nr:hypothetical protein [Deltaproteobacteria bacterium]